MAAPAEIATARLRLRRFTPGHAAAFAAMHADPAVMQDHGAPLGRIQSDTKLDRYIAAFALNNHGRWAIETPEGRFLGYAGIQPVSPHFPLPAGTEIGWRLIRKAWGFGYASEAAAAALADAWQRCGLDEIMAFTTEGNDRSEAVMRRLGMARRAALDFRLPGSGAYCVVYAARP